jgi:cardiolipin synthase
MPAEVTGANWNWLRAGQEIFPAMLQAIDSARHSVFLETYIYSPGPLGERFRDALTLACQRGARVRVLVDAFGSFGLPDSFWKALRDVGGEIRWFNPISLNRVGIRDHRKLLICDEEIAFVGGFNIATEYEGDGIACGWCDIGLKVQGLLAARLADAFMEMFARADFHHRWLLQLRGPRARKIVRAPHEQLLLSGPGLGRSPIKRALLRDLARARNVRIVVAYFLPTWRLRRALTRVAHRGGTVQLILAGKSDVLISQLAARSLYRRLLKAGVQIWEYQPQILHAKLLIVDDVAYAGSANLDQRSLNINYELMVRFESQAIAARARGIFDDILEHCRQITLEEWTRGRSLWQRLRERWAYLLLVRIDPYLALRQWRTLPLWNTSLRKNRRRGK